MNYIRRKIAQAICFVSGHLLVIPQSVPSLIGVFFQKNTEYVCLRCMKQYRPIHDSADAFFAESPFQKAIRQKSTNQDQSQMPVPEQFK